MSFAAIFTQHAKQNQSDLAYNHFFYTESVQNF